ncbi:MAG: response regulator [Candidatus Krumholzibacteriia bacterium]
MGEPRARVLVVDESDQELRIHAATLRAQGYEVATARRAEEALRQVAAATPDLFLIDARMKGMDGYTLCERLKEDGRLATVPVVFVTETPTAEEIDRGYAVGGVDYIVKPCHLSEFLARVNTHLRLHRLLQENERLRQLAIDSNPLTHLPGNNSVVAAIQACIDEGSDLCAIYADLDNFKAYNDRYGFSDGDDLLLFTAETLQTAIRKVCGEDEGFLGHIGGDDFVLLVPAGAAVQVGEEVIRRFDSGVPDFYTDEDAVRGYIVSEDRQGNHAVFPLVSISLGGVMLSRRRFKKYIEAADVCAEVKHRAKRLPGSNIFLDRRDELAEQPRVEPERVAGGSLAITRAALREERGLAGEEGFAEGEFDEDWRRPAGRDRPSAGGEHAPEILPQSSPAATRTS